ncbi:hypothetical protein NL676_030689 [Syzygium grande]|nr:hypothetical protein NL676_030689 [Syzygium grande]
MRLICAFATETTKHGLKIYDLELPDFPRWLPRGIIGSSSDSPYRNALNAFFISSLISRSAPSPLVACTSSSPLSPDPFLLHCWLMLHLVPFLVPQRRDSEGAIHQVPQDSSDSEKEENSEAVVEDSASFELVHHDYDKNMGM